MPKTPSLIYNHFTSVNITKRHFTLQDLLKSRQQNYEPQLKQLLQDLSLADTSSTSYAYDLTQTIREPIDAYDMNYVAHAKEHTNQLATEEEIDAVIEKADILEQDKDFFKRIGAAYLKVSKMPVVPAARK